MKILVYCYGPTCAEKDFFCEKFIEENDDYELVSSSSIRLKLSKSAIVENKIVGTSFDSKIKKQIVRDTLRLPEEKKNKMDPLG
jgi:hypothetical protein